MLKDERCKQSRDNRSKQTQTHPHSKLSWVPLPENNTAGYEPSLAKKYRIVQCEYSDQEKEPLRPALFKEERRAARDLHDADPCTSQCPQHRPRGNETRSISNLLGQQYSHSKQEVSTVRDRDGANNSDNHAATTRTGHGET